MLLKIKTKFWYWFKRLKRKEKIEEIGWDTKGVSKIVSNKNSIHLIRGGR